MKRPGPNARQVQQTTMIPEMMERTAFRLFNASDTRPTVKPKTTIPAIIAVVNPVA